MWHLPPRDILVAIDFGEPSARAVGVAGSLATRTGARLTAVYAEIFEPPAYFTSDQLDRFQAQHRQARRAAEKHLLSFAGEQTTAPVHGDVVELPPAEAVLQATHGKDLLVMGTHGRRGPSRWWLGSVAERVVRSSSVPVLVVRSAPPDTPPSAPFLRPLVLQPGGMSPSAALGYARWLAQAFSGEIETADTASCSADTLARGSVVIVPTGPGAEHTIPDTTLLTTCNRPILFVPARVSAPALEQPA
jgi:nucleotide-binding universal stress UspA family protein